MRYKSIRRFAAMTRVACKRGAKRRMPVLRFIAIIALFGLLTACGVRGSLEPPPNAAAQPEDPEFVLDGMI